MTRRITPLSERLKAREKDLASIPTHIANLLAEAQNPIFAWASDVDLALQSLGEACDRLRAQYGGQQAAVSDVPKTWVRGWNDPKMDSYNVPEPAVIAPLQPRFVDNGDGTVTDNKTGLTWGPTAPKKMTLEEALAYCEGLNFAGHSDWRLPTIEELASIVDYTRKTPACDPILGMCLVYYWSASMYAPNSQYAWGVHFCTGGTLVDYRTSTFSVRPVRGGKP